MIETIIAPIIGIALWLIGKILFNKLKKPNKIAKQNMFTCKYTNFIASILIPVLLSIIIYFLIFLIYQKPISINPEMLNWSSWFVILKGGIIGPIFEELCFRAVIFGALVTLIDVKIKDMKLHKIAIFVAFLLQVFVFMFIHNYSFFDVPRMLFGLAFGGLYLLNKRNIFPSIIAHAAANLIIILFWIVVWT